MAQVITPSKLYMALNPRFQDTFKHNAPEACKKVDKGVKQNARASGWQCRTVPELLCGNKKSTRSMSLTSAHNELALLQAFELVLSSSWDSSMCVCVYIGYGDCVMLDKSVLQTLGKKSPMASRGENDACRRHEASNCSDFQIDYHRTQPGFQPLSEAGSASWTLSAARSPCAASQSAAADCSKNRVAQRPPRKGRSCPRLPAPTKQCSSKNKNYLKLEILLIRFHVFLSSVPENNIFHAHTM